MHLEYLSKAELRPTKRQICLMLAVVSNELDVPLMRANEVR